MLYGHTEKRMFLIGEKLGHSFSPDIHAHLADYSYTLKELSRDELPAFFANRDFDGLNVTIPYKRDVIPLLDCIDAAAKQIGAVNTVVKKNGRLYGYNTDYYGFSHMLDESGIAVENEKVLVLGSGGASKTAVAVLRDRGARVTVISRSGDDHYGNLDRHKDAAAIVNTTPVGMYPNNGLSPISLSDFPACRGVLDLIYNPEKTALLLEAEAKGIPCQNGLSMLVAQAKYAAELFLGEAIPDNTVKSVTETLARSRRNIVLIGMPGCGKTTVGQLLADRLSRRLLDTDAIVIARKGKNIPSIFKEEGEASFRKYEEMAASVAGRETGAVIATGGGIILRKENIPHLRQNGVIVFLRRELRSLATNGRPLSDPAKLEEMYAHRRPLYEAIADVTLDMSDTPEETADRLIKELYQ